MIIIDEERKLFPKKNVALVDHFITFQYQGYRNKLMGSFSIYLLYNNIKNIALRTKKSDMDVRQKVLIKYLFKVLYLSQRIGLSD